MAEFVVLEAKCAVMLVGVGKAVQIEQRTLFGTDHASG